MWLNIICSIILQETKVRETGLQFEASDLSPALKMACMFAFFQSCGTSPICSESDKNRCRNGAISWAAFCSTQHGIWSGPAAFFASRLLNSLVIPTVSKCNWEMLGKACGRDGRFSRSSSVKTDLNCSYKRSAFFLLSCTASPIPFSFKGEIPTSSFFIVLIKDQKRLPRVGRSGLVVEYINWRRNRCRLLITCSLLLFWIYLISSNFHGSVVALLCFAI